jgi:hypothetical protein
MTPKPNEDDLQKAIDKAREELAMVEMYQGFLQAALTRARAIAKQRGVTFDESEFHPARPKGHQRPNIIIKQILREKGPMEESALEAEAMERGAGNGTDEWEKLKSIRISIELMVELGSLVRRRDGKIALP